jgi:hypothetical protein
VRACVWVAVSARRIAGAVFFKEIINRERYVQTILGQLFPELTEEERLYGWFQQDSATAHIAYMSMHALSDFFGERMISSGIWPARSPDLNLSDIFFF